MDIEEIAPSSLDPLLGDVSSVYRSAFATTDGDAGEYVRGVIPRHRERKGFRFLAAFDRGRLVGFAYGYTGEPGQFWHDLVAETLDPAARDRWMNGAIEVVTLAVETGSQGRGVGGQLHDRLLRGLPNRTVLLSTGQEESPARRLYRNRGWVIIKEPYYFPNNPAPTKFMGLDRGSG